MLCCGVLCLLQSFQDSGHPELADRLNKTIGFGMGLEFREGEEHNTLCLPHCHV